MRARHFRDAIDVVCPRCGSSHATRISRLDQTRTCAKCGVTFAINEQGRYVVETGWTTTRLGKRWGATRKLLPWKSLASGWGSAGRAGSSLAGRWARIARPWQLLISVGGGCTLVVLLFCGLFSRWASRDEAPKEHSESLHSRAELACQALLLGDPGVLAGLSTRDTQSDSTRWMQRVRAPHWPSSAESAKTAEVELRTLFKSLKTHRAAVYYTIRTGARSADGHPDVEGTLCWTLGHDGRWQLDGRRTLEELSMARSTD
jgi:hypothetical protein